MLRRAIVLLTLLLSLAGCNKPASEPTTAVPRPALPAANAPGEAAAPNATGGMDAATAAPTVSSVEATPKTAIDHANGMPRKIIYTVEMTLVTESLDKVATTLEAWTKAAGGYVSNATQSGERGAIRQATWTIRIPVDHFESFIADLHALGELESSNRKAEDVSEEFYDVDARLRNKRVEETRLIELLRNATGKLTDVLTVERELSRVREEIEQVQGRLRFLSNQTELSTVTLNLREEKNFIPEGLPTVATRLGRAMFASIDQMREFGIGLLVFGAALLPWLVPLALPAGLFIGWRRLRSR